MHGQLDRQSSTRTYFSPYSMVPAEHPKGAAHRVLRSMNAERDDCLNVHEFGSIEQARQKIEAWRVDYNDHRPHGALAHLTPSEYAGSGRKRDVEGAPL